MSKQFDTLLEHYFNKIKASTQIKHFYSPVYNKQFDLLSDDEIKHQLRCWLNESIEEVKQEKDSR